MQSLKTQYIFSQAIVGGSKTKKKRCSVKRIIIHSVRSIIIHKDSNTLTYSNVINCYNCQMNLISSQLMLYYNKTKYEFVELT